MSFGAVLQTLSETRQEARALTRRIPSTLIQHDPVIQHGIAILRSIYQNNFSETYALLRGQPWPKPVDNVVQRFDGKYNSAVMIGRHHSSRILFAAYYTEKSFRNISRIYESIRPEIAAEYLGLQNNAELIDIMVKRGWQWDAGRELFLPHVPDDHVKIGKSRPPSNQISRVVGLASV